MRKLLLTAMVSGLLGAGALMIPASATSTCDTGASPGGTGGSGSVGLPIGCVEANGDAATQSGYVVADGVESNPEPGDGYIGVDSSDGGPTVVGCASGDYAPGGANNVVVSPNSPPEVPPATDDPCTPAGP